jgi:hypothetical protein
MMDPAYEASPIKRARHLPAEQLRVLQSAEESERELLRALVDRVAVRPILGNEGGS